MRAKSYLSRLSPSVALAAAVVACGWTAVLLQGAAPGAIAVGLLATALVTLMLRAQVKARRSSEQTAAQLRASEQRNRRLFMDSPLPSWVYDLQTRTILDVNAAAVAHYGWSREEFLRMTIFDIRPPEDVPALLANLTRGNFPAAAHRVRHRRKDGRTIAVEVSSHAFVLDGRAARLVVAHDITAREAAESARRTLEARFGHLSDSGIIGITVANTRGAIIDANDAFLRMTGYTRVDLEAGSLDWDALTPPEWKHVNSRMVGQMREHGFAGPLEKEYLRKDGSRLHVLVGMSFIDRRTVLAFVLDISERKRLEQLERAAVELEAENRRIQEANRTKSAFLANMSHELRTPLNAIIGFTEMLYDGVVGAPSGDQRECLGNVLISSRHLLQLINDILDLAKVESGKLEFHPEPLELRELIGEVVATLRTPIDGKQVRVETEVEPALGVVTADPVRLKQVLYNYVSNAIKFSPAGAEVVVRSRPEGDHDFRIEVEDHGVGIEPDEVKRLFVDFQQLDSSSAKKYAGTGLGLALTRRLVEAQGGTVGVRSTPGRGSVFHAVLPRRPRAARPHPEETCPATAS